QNDLPDVVTGMAKGFLNGQRYRVWLVAYGYCLVEIFRLQILDRIEQACPPLFPQRQKLGPVRSALDKFAVSISPGLFAISREEIRPARDQVAGNVGHDDGDGIGFGIESRVNLIIRHLVYCSVSETLVGFESVNG